MPFFRSSRNTLRLTRGRLGARSAFAPRGSAMKQHCWELSRSLQRRLPLYDKFPYIPSGSREECVLGWHEIIEAIRSRASSATVVVLECYPGVFLDEFRRELSAGMPQAALLCTTELFRPSGEIDKMLEPWLGDDPVFGMMNSVEVENFFDAEKLSAARAHCEQTREFTVVLGPGASLV